MLLYEFNDNVFKIFFFKRLFVWVYYLWIEMIYYWMIFFGIIIIESMFFKLVREYYVYYNNWVGFYYNILV